MAGLCLVMQQGLRAAQGGNGQGVEAPPLIHLPTETEVVAFLDQRPEVSLVTPIIPHLNPSRQELCG